LALFTVLFANFAEAVAEGRGKAQANALRKTRTRRSPTGVQQADRRRTSRGSPQKGDVVVAAGEVILQTESDRGIASVDESTITGEPAPRSGKPAATGTRSPAVPGLVGSPGHPRNRQPGESFLDHMIHLVEGAQRQKHPTRSP
jgi:K+-transporting ATPase ATPase B chain